MDRQSAPDFAEALAGALDWWREAGVDCDFSDEPSRWTEPAEEALPPKPEPQPAAAEARAPAQAKQPEAPVASPAFDASKLPGDLESFSQWWMTEPALAEGAVSSRLAPRGATGAELMVIVPEPEREDSQSLLTGPQGRLLDAMLAAMGYGQDQVYLASALPRHLPGTDWQAIAAQGMGAVLARHVSLVAPKRLVMFGTNILPLAGNDPPQGPASLRIFNHEGSSIPLLACRSLAALLEQPRWKARVWQAWLEWTA